ncbi:MAG: hypothetical protein M0R22_00200 [Dehalococcoidia bacterium]|jgi:hypothetical protein|nr:hypothetical protein [Dehalococcoidia bacterium]
MAYTPFTVKDAGGRPIPVEDYVDRQVWSGANIASSASADVTMFKFSKGESVAASGTASAVTGDFRHTNVQYKGTMPQTDGLEVRTVAYEFPPDVTLTALQQLSERIWTEFYFGSERPSYAFLARHAPPGTGLWGVTTVTAVSMYNVGEPNPSHRLKFNIPLILRPGDQFRADIRIQGGALTTAAADVFMRLVLRGSGPTAV